MEGPVSTSVRKEMEIRDSIQPEAAQTIGNTTVRPATRLGAAASHTLKTR